MKKYNFQILCLLSLLAFLGCKEVIFIPIQGAIEGYITDNNGDPISGVTVSATFVAATSSGQAFPSTKSTSTNNEGYYKLIELWDEVEINIQHAGFESMFQFIDLQGNPQPELNIELVGSPTIQAITLNKNTLALNTQALDTILAKIEILDVYNSQFGNYSGNLILQNSAGKAQSIFATTNEIGSQNLFLLEALITNGELPQGTYSVLVEATDPDGNTHQLIADQTIQLE